MTTWDQSVDLVIVGSGGGALVAALAAADAGLQPLVVEKQARVGGSTAMSGGVIWIPNNPLMKTQRISDSDEEGLAYLEAVVGDIGPASSLERRKTFLTAGSQMISYLQEKGVELIGCPGYSDYYDTTGSKASGRSIEPTPFDEHKLGEWSDKIQRGRARTIGLHVTTNESRQLVYYNRSWKSFVVAARVWLRTMTSRLRGQDLVVSGESLIAQTLKIVLDSGIPVWTDCPLDEVIVENGRAAGIRVLKDGAPLVIEARKGVLLAAGGFARNAEMRRKYSADQPNDAQWTIANQGDTGEALGAAMAMGARTDLLDEAWWTPAPILGLSNSTLVMARQRPGAILVDSRGERFCNESNSYVEVGKAMYAVHAVPCWLIFDDGYRRRYAAAKSLPGRLPPEWFETGLVKRADTVEKLASIIGVDVDGLVDTIQRFNVNAAKGIDPDFGRGTSAYNRCMGDPGYKPNAAVGPLDKAPYFATQIYPADVGTCGGVITNEHAQVIGKDDVPIPGLYATGNTTATLMGRTYPGAGASIAYSMVFGFVAARHAAGDLRHDI